MEGEIDKIYRINTSYARRHKVPREVHVKFIKKSTKDEILKRVRDYPLQYRGKEIVVLKQIPRRVSDLRKQYQLLTVKLIKRQVNVRWLVPEGILVNWDGKRYRLDLLDKVIDFYDSYIVVNEKQEENWNIKDEEPTGEEKNVQQEGEGEKAE
uniref:L1 transposable element RRM domain-containing protein n=1 Tax=Micrurus paraensis TaxID=1970185 RepID=A0A2D4K3B7_9SAUR